MDRHWGSRLGYYTNSRKVGCYISVSVNGIFHIYIYIGVGVGAVDWGTTLKAGRSWVLFLFVSLEFFIDIILPAALWPWVRHSLQQK